MLSQVRLARVSESQLLIWVIGFPFPFSWEAVKVGCHGCLLTVSGKWGQHEGEQSWETGLGINRPLILWSSCAWSSTYTEVLVLCINKYTLLSSVWVGSSVTREPIVLSLIPVCFCISEPKADSGILHCWFKHPTPLPVFVGSALHTCLAERTGIVFKQCELQSPPYLQIGKSHMFLGLQQTLWLISGSGPETQSSFPAGRGSQPQAEIRWQGTQDSLSLLKG